MSCHVQIEQIPDDSAFKNSIDTFNNLNIADKGPRVLANAAYGVPLVLRETEGIK